MFNFHKKKDTQLRKDVLDELSWDPSISSNQISVTASGGVITLRGTVPHYFEKTKAEQIVQRVSGVRAIADEIEVSRLMGVRGKVHSLSESTEACTAAWNAPGVMKVVNDIRICN